MRSVNGDVRGAFGATSLAIRPNQRDFTLGELRSQVGLEERKESAQQIGDSPVLLRKMSKSRRIAGPYRLRAGPLPR
jgi:hypothetical protein